MTIEQIQEFVTLAEQRNYLIAADIMYVTQATLSRHIMALEEELGFPLFDRSTKHIELTAEGTHFLVYARDIVKLKNSYTEAISLKKRQNAGVLRVGYNYLVSLYNINIKMTNFISLNPKSNINIIEDSPQNLVRAVEEGTCDLAIFQEDPFNRVHNIDQIRLHCDTLTAVVHVSNPLAKKKSLILPEMKNEKFVTSSPGQPPVNIMFEACRRSGFSPNIARTGFVGRTVFDFIRANPDYVSLEWKVPALFNKDDKIALIDVEPPLYFYTVLIYNKDTISPLGKEFINYMKKETVEIQESVFR